MIRPFLRTRSRLLLRMSSPQQRSLIEVAGGQPTRTDSLGCPVQAPLGRGRCDLAVEPLSANPY
jgi:hypothetical protein